MKRRHIAIGIIVIIAGLVTALQIWMSTADSMRIRFYETIGLPGGRFIVFNGAGVPQQYGQVINGLKHSEWLYWHPNGLLWARKYYVQNRLIDGSFFDHTGRTVSYIRNGNGIYAGFSDGRVVQLKSFRDGMMEGPTVTYYGDGSVLGVGHYIEGSRPHGHSISVWENGIIKTIRYHERGVLQTEVHFSKSGASEYPFEQISPLAPESQPPLLDGQRIVGIGWDQGLRSAEYWAENSNGVWYLRHRLLEDTDATQMSEPGGRAYSGIAGGRLMKSD